MQIEALLGQLQSELDILVSSPPVATPPPPPPARPPADEAPPAAEEPAPPAPAPPSPAPPSMAERLRDALRSVQSGHSRQLPTMQEFLAAVKMVATGEDQQQPAAGAAAADPEQLSRFRSGAESAGVRYHSCHCLPLPANACHCLPLLAKHPVYRSAVPAASYCDAVAAAPMPQWRRARCRVRPAARCDHIASL